MSLRFEWYDIIDHEVITSKTKLVVDKICQRRTIKGTKQKVQLTTKKLLSALYHSYFSFPKGSNQVSISLTSGHYSNTNYSFRMVSDVFNCLSELKWIEFEKGSEAKGKVTRIWAVGELSLVFDSIGLLWLPQDPKPNDSLVVLRNYKYPKGKTKKERGDKIDIDVPETAKVNTYRSNLFDFNQFLLKHCISLELDDENLNFLANEIANRAKDKTRTWFSEEEEKVGYLDLSRVQLRRIFSRGSLEQGGRFYGAWWQCIPSSHRPHIRIDGYKTYEMDYSSMALRIIYAQEGIEVSEGKDLYDIGLSDWKPEDDPRRKPIKTYINAILNDEFGNYRLPKFAQDILGIKHKELHEKVLECHEPISHLFNSGEGLKAQFIDSQIAEEVMVSMMHEEVLVLPIHDSFIVRAGYAQWLNEEMHKAFKKIVNAGVGVTIEGSKSNKHFGMTIEEVQKIDNLIVPFGSEEMWEEFIRADIMDRYLSSWKQNRLE